MTSRNLHFQSQSRYAFTLMELMVSVAILVLIILSVGVVFQSASKSVGVSQSSMEMLSNVQAMEGQLERDVAGMDKGAFLAIRSQVDATTGRRFDQMSFISRGTFRHRTGNTGSSSPFTDSTTAPAALVWWGQLAIEQGNTAPSSHTDSKQYLIPNQNVAVALDQVPNGVLDSDFLLGRSAILLIPQDAAGNVAGGKNDTTPNGTSIAAYSNQSTVPISAIDYDQTIGPTNPQPLIANSTSDGAIRADITKSRIDAAATNPGEIMSFLEQRLTVGRTANTSISRYEADHFCYRRATLRTPYDSELNSLVNGTFRMHPIVMQGVSSLAIEWTDGSSYKLGDHDTIKYPPNATPPNGGIPVGDPLIGTTKWFGFNNTKNGTNTVNVDNIDGPVPGTMTMALNQGNNDVYTAIFSFDNRVSPTVATWPLALRVRFHVSDASGRLPGGRDFVQIVRLPTN